ncbi:MAG: hypothetical protein NVSMB47_03560 [Polyangiales bacterium]
MAFGGVVSLGPPPVAVADGIAFAGSTPGTLGVAVAVAVFTATGALVGDVPAEGSSFEQAPARTTNRQETRRREARMG